MQKVIVDTSIWIDHFKGALKEPIRSLFRRLVDNEQAAITDIIRYELLVGAKTQKEFNILSDFTTVLPIYNIDSFTAQERTEFGFQLNRKGLLGSFTDVCIAFIAIKNDASILSHDRYFRKLGLKGIIRNLIN